MAPPRLPAVLLILLGLLEAAAGGMLILSKSRVEKCVRDSDTGGSLSCDKKIVVDVAVPSGASGGEDSLVAQVAAVEGNTTAEPTSILNPPVITVNKSAVYAAYDLTYLWDVAYKPEEQFVETRKCEPDAGADVVKSCERLRNASGSIIEHTEPASMGDMLGLTKTKEHIVACLFSGFTGIPVCCPCGDHRAHTSCGNVFDKMVKGKRNTAHCVRFPGEWFHVFGIGTRSLGFTIRVQVKKGSSISEFLVGPDNMTAVSGDNFIRVSVVGDFLPYKSMPTFEDTYLVTPRKGEGSGQPEVIGDEYSRWMLLKQFYFTENGLECNKIGVGYQAFQNQPDFCSVQLGSCLFSQLWHFMEEDKNRMNKNQTPRHVVGGRFERINQHPNAGVYSFSVGITQTLKTNLLIELKADDVQYVYQRSPGKIIGFKVPTFEALSQVGVANVTTRNIGQLEASYSLTFKCSSGIADVEEQSYVMKPKEAISRFFSLHTSTDKAETYTCTAILKAANFSEADRATCQFSTTSTVLNNGTQIGPPIEHKKKGGIMGMFEDVKAFFRWIWDSVVAFFTGTLCRSKCSSFFDFRCHFQNLCVGWMVISSVLILATVLPVAMLLWMMHERGFFDHLYDWWKDLLGLEPHHGAHMRHRRGHHHRGRQHAHQEHRSGPGHHHHHHRVLHRHDEQQPDAVEGGRRHRQREVFLGVQHGNEHKHRRGKEMAALHLDGPSRLHGTDDRERRHHRRHGHHREHHHLRSE